LLISRALVTRAGRAELLASAASQNPDSALVTTLAREIQINTFFRLQNPEVIDALRALRNDWCAWRGC